MKKTIAIRNRLFSFLSAAIISLNSIPLMSFTTAYAESVASATNSGKVDFPAVASSAQSAKLNHDDTLVDNGDGTFTFTSKITSDYSYSDYSESRLKSKDGEYILDKAGKYLIEVWGGDGGDGSRSFLTGRNGVGGKGGFVYGILDVSEENELLGKKLVYEIGSKGESSTFQLDGGGTGGVGGGAGQITFISIGAGGGYSAVYLLNSDEELDPADRKPNLRDYPSNVLMIAGGGGGGAAGGNGVHFYELFLKAKGDGGDGGSKEGSNIIATPNIGDFDTGKYYSGGEGTSAGGNTKYVGHGGTDKPGAATRDALNIIKGENPNDWQRLYIEDGDRGAGSAGNLRGAGGGAGFAGGSGGLQNAMLDANNVGGGGGGSSYTAPESDTFKPYATLTANQEPYFVQPDGNTNADVGGAVVIRYLPDDADYNYLNNVKISGTVSDYFDIVSATCTDKGGGAITVNQSGTDNRKIDFTGSVKPVASGIAKGQADDSLTLKLVLRPITNFMGGNKVPIFKTGTFDCVTQVPTFTQTCDFTYDDNVRYVNIPFKYKAGAKSKTISKDTPYGESDIIDSTVTNTLDANFAESVSYPYVAEVNQISKITDFTVADYNTKGLHKFDVVVEVVPKYDGADYVGTANPNPTYIRARSVIEIIEGETLDGFTVKASKSLVYNNGPTDSLSDDTYDFTVDFDVESQSSLNKSFSINQAIPSVKVLDLNIGGNGTSNPYISLTQNSGSNIAYSGTLQPGIYYIEAWGGDGGSGGGSNNSNTPPSDPNTNPGSGKYGGYGGKGGYISGFVSLDSEKSINITLGTKGADSSSDTGSGKGGKATYVDIGTTQDKMTFIAGGGGGGSNYLNYGSQDGSDHMGYSGNDGYRVDGVSVYRGIPSDSDYTEDRPLTSGVDYDEDKYDGADGKTVKATYTLLGRQASSYFDETFDNNNAAKYFAKGGYSKIGDGVSAQLTGANAGKLFINTGSENISLSELFKPERVVNVDLGYYEYVYWFYDEALIFGLGTNKYYISQWANKSSSASAAGYTPYETDYYSKDDNFKRKSYYKGTTKTGQQIKTQKAGAVRITRLGVCSGYDYGDTRVNNIGVTKTANKNTVVGQIRTDYVAEVDPFTVTSNFSEYFELIANGTAYNITSDANGKYTGTYTYNFDFDSDDVYEVSNSSSTDTTTFAGYSVDIDTYTYGLKGSDSVTFKLRRKSNLVGGCDIPLLDKTINEPSPDNGTTAVKVEHSGITTESPPDPDDVLYLRENDATDYANVAIDGSVLSVSSPATPIIIDCGGETPDLSSAVTFAGYPNGYYFVDTESDIAPSGAVTEDCKLTVIGTIKPKAATKAVKIPSVEAVSKHAEADIKVRYSVTKNLTDIEQQGSVQYISSTDGETYDIVSDVNEAILDTGTNNNVDKLTLTKIDDAYVLYLVADSSHELPEASAVTVRYSDGKDVDANVTKSNGVITVTIPRSSFTNNITITATGAAKKEYHVHYYYEYYDSEVPNAIQTAHFEDTGPYYVSGTIVNKTGDFTPDEGEYPPWGGYANYYWEWSDEVTSGTHTIVDGDLYVTGKFVKRNIPLYINYVMPDGDATPPPAQYSAPMAGYNTTVYMNGKYYWYAVAGETYMVPSPEIDGYYPDQAEVVFDIPDDVSETTYQDGITKNVHYIAIDSSKVDDNVIVNLIKCDEYGIPLDGSNTTVQSYLVTEGVVFDKTSEISSWVDALGDDDEYEIINMTRLADDEEVDVESISGKLASGEKAVFYVRYRPKPPTVTVRFNEVDEDNVAAENRPDKADVTIGTSSRNVVPEREYGYDPDKNQYVGLPTPECRSSGADWISSGWKFAGWYDENGNPVDETTIVPSGIDPIELYAHWQPLQVTITIDYRYAYNVNDGDLQGEQVPKASLGIDDNPKTLIKAYGMVYKVESPPLTGYSPDPEFVEGEARESKTETVYYKDGDPTAAEPEKKIRVEVYSSSYEGSDGKPVTGAKKLIGGTFRLYDGSGNPIGEAQYNEDGSVSWSSIKVKLVEGDSYTVKCIDPPSGYGSKSIPIIAFTPDNSSNEDVYYIFLDKSQFQLPMAGGAPLRGYTICGVSTMLLAAFLLYLYVNKEAEEKENE
ncbi:glycine-rich protein [Ruminococcus flavefaciens]|uniref:glycine-rich protein n=1 Tax=Ruminococcus flavefaciens TaxID=1265 RepID=UPI00048F6D99|nr:glycine-rich protein [Ruminococcus flavefaciens]